MNQEGLKAPQISQSTGAEKWTVLKGGLVLRRRKRRLIACIAGGAWRQRKDCGPRADVQECRKTLMLRGTGPGRTRHSSVTRACLLTPGGKGSHARGKGKKAAWEGLRLAEHLPKGAD